MADDEWGAAGWDHARQLERELAEARGQRNTLAEALEYLMQSCESIDCEAMMPAAMPFAYIKAKQALAAVKGGEE